MTVLHHLFIATGYELGSPGIESRWGARFSAPVQTGPGAHPTSCTMGTGSSPGGKERPGRDDDPSPLLVPRSKNRVELYLYSPLRVFVAYKKGETYPPALFDSVATCFGLRVSHHQANCKNCAKGTLESL